MTCWPIPGRRGASSSSRPTAGDRVAVALEHVVVAQELDRQGEEDEAEDEPVGLVAGQVGVDPVDHHQAEGRQQRHQREEVGIGVGQADAQVEVGGEADGEEVGAVDQAEVVEPGVLLGEDRGEAGGEQQGDRDEGEQLPVAGGDHLDAPGSLRCLRPARRRRARERRSWPVTASGAAAAATAVWIGLA